MRDGIDRVIGSAEQPWVHATYCVRRLTCRFANDGPLRVGLQSLDGEA